MKITLLVEKIFKEQTADIICWITYDLFNAELLNFICTGGLIKLSKLLCNFKLLLYFLSVLKYDGSKVIVSIIELNYI